MINVVVCDDEENILKEIVDIVENKLVNKRVVCNVVAINDARILLEKLKENPIDVLFLDIDMPYYSGMDIASFINENMLPTVLVFVTSHDELVFKTFAYKPFGFLRKSHIEEEIEELVDRLSKELEFRKQELVITKAGEIVKLPLCDINYIESEGNYLNIRVGEEIIRHRETMSNMENELKTKDFIRCHKGYYFVELESVREILYWNMRKFAGYPISIYGKIIQGLMIYVVPFAFVNYFPAQYLLRKPDMANYNEVYMYIAPLVGVVVYGLAYLFWRVSVKRYTSTGN